MRKNHKKAFDPLINRIKSLEGLNTLSKHECIIQGVLDCIDANELQVHSMLPSVNYFIDNLGYARETFAKAYRDLIAHGIVESKKRKGYFVVSNNTQISQKVAIILYAYDTFQDTLVTEFRNSLPDDVIIDLFFHHNNIEIFEDIFNRIYGRYTLYVVAPIENEKSRELLSSISTTKLLIIDRYIELGDECSFISQEFRSSTYVVFEKLHPKIKKYKEIVFFFRENTAEPQDIKDSFLEFVKKHNIKGQILRNYKSGSLEKGKLYFTIHNPELYLMLKEVLQKGWVIGEDLGILSHNDDVIKEIISGGITTFSVDFGEIGRKAAQFVINKEKVRIIMPTILTDRNSL